MAIFLTTIVAIILKVMPIGVMALMALMVIVIVSVSQGTSTSSKGAISDALSSFSNPLIWLTICTISIFTTVMDGKIMA